MTPSQLLACLGDSPDAVASTLRDLGIRGVRGHAGSCPIARYLAGHGHSMAVTGRFARTAAHADVPLPEPVELFVLDFDSGEYPELLDPAEVTP